jgi:hypothetical protein
MIPLRTAVGIVSMLVVAGCASVQNGRPLVRDVDIVTPVPCEPAIGPGPAFPDSDEALRAAPNLFSRVQLLVAGRLLRVARQRELEAALSACAAPLAISSDLPHS